MLPPPLKKKNSTCSLLTISNQEVKKILKELGVEKSTTVDMKNSCFLKMQRLPQLLP